MTTTGLCIVKKSIVIRALGAVVMNKALSSQIFFLKKL